MDALGLDRVHFVGESIGGMVGYHFAYQYPERLKTLTAANCPGPTLKGHRMSLLAGLLRQKGVAAAVDYIASRHSDERSEVPGLDNWIHTEMKKCPLDATLGLVEAAADVDADAFAKTHSSSSAAKSLEACVIEERRRGFLDGNAFYSHGFFAACASSHPIRIASHSSASTPSTISSFRLVNSRKDSTV